jgi:hypothetical protein
MSNNDDEQERRARAEELRRQIRSIKSEPPPAEEPEIKPGESPKEYMDRRQREMEKNKPADLNE